jgi:glycosyltransferase involved in cell wall biosynthesis
MTNAPSAPAGRPRPRVVAVLPAYNLERSIAAIVERTKPFVDVVVVTADGSRDGTAVAARAAGAVVPDPEAVRGKGFALIKGIEATKALGAEVVVVMDSDGQHLPEEIPVVVGPLLEGRGDMVVGSRMLGTLRTSTINKFGNFGLKLISFAVTWRWLTDTESGFRAFRAEKLYSLPLSSRGYEIESELLLRSLHAGFQVTEVPIHVPFAVPGVTVWDGLKVGWYKVKVGLGLRLGTIQSRRAA